MYMRDMGIAFALGLSLSVSAVAAEKVTGVNKDFVILSETSTAVPDKAGHAFKQLTMTFKGTSSAWGEFWADQVSNRDVVGNETTERGYGTSHYSSGDLYWSIEGTHKITPKDGGDFELVVQGKSYYLGGTGKFKNAKGPGTYICKFSTKGGQCDWEVEADL